MKRRFGHVIAGLGVLLALGGCGLDVQEPDLFLIIRSGQATTLTMVVNDSGTIRCDGAKAKPISNALLIQARDLSDNLGGDASHNLSLPVRPGTVFTYKIQMQQGTITFADRDTKGFPVLSQAELFTAQAAQQGCGLSG